MKSQTALTVTSTMIMGLAPAGAYSTRPTSHNFVANKFGVRTSNPSAVQHVSYDLGIGKNHPVTAGQDPRKTPLHLNRKDAAAFLVEHEAVNVYPHPPSLAANQKKSKIKPVVPIRLSDDILHIFQVNDAQTPTIVPVDNSVSNFDLNTPWVEMLIHEQQQKLQMA